MEVKFVVVGATKLPKKLAASAHKAGGRFWVPLPLIRDDEEFEERIDRFVKKLGGEARVIEVEMSTGLRGEDVSAWTYLAPGREDEQDLTEIAAETLSEWTDGEGAMEEEVAVNALAWALVDLLAEAIDGELTRRG